MTNMTEDELLEWGRGEDAARKADLADIYAGGAGAATLQRAKDRAKARRNAVGLSRGDAVRAVKLAQRGARGRG
jgi:hypothetical protein